jgi:hypothetical protein
MVRCFLLSVKEFWFIKLKIKDNYFTDHETPLVSVLVPTYGKRRKIYIITIN